MNIITKKETAKKCGGVHPLTVMRWATDPKWSHLAFPKPINVGPNRVGFDEAEVDEYLERRAAERDLAGEAA